MQQAVPEIPVDQMNTDHLVMELGNCWQRMTSYDQMLHQAEESGDEAAMLMYGGLATQSTERTTEIYRRLKHVAPDRLAAIALGGIMPVAYDQQAVQQTAGGGGGGDRRRDDRGRSRGHRDDSRGRRRRDSRDRRRDDSRDRGDDHRRRKRSRDRRDSRDKRRR